MKYAGQLLLDVSKTPTRGRGRGVFLSGFFRGLFATYLGPLDHSGQRDHSVNTLIKAL